MRVLITGGAGFIAFHLASRLQDDGFEVSLLDNFNRFYDPALKRKNVRDLQARGEARLWETDILDAAALRRVFDETRPQGVVHLAAWAGVRPSLENPEIYASVNVTGTANVLQLAREYGTASFIFGSSSSVYGGSDRVPFSEDDPVDRPVSPYAATKRAGELLCHTYAHNYPMRITCLRFFTVYGPRQRPDLAIHKFAHLISSGKPIPVFGDGSTARDYTYVTDTVDGVMACTERQFGYDVINLGESQTVRLDRLIQLLEHALGKKAIIDRQPPQPGDVPITYADISKARERLGYNPRVKIEEGIRLFIDWFRQEPH